MTTFPPASERRCHVAHLTTVHVPFDTRIFHKECRTLAEAGYRVTLLARHDRAETRDGVEIVPLPTYRSRPRRMLLGAWSAYRAARSLRADLYHFHDPELLPVGVLLKWTTNARVVYDVHENYAAQLGARGWMPDLLRPLLPPLVGLFEKLAARTFDAVVTATAHIAALFPRQKTVVVQNYPFADRAQTPPDDAAYAPGNSRLIYTGGWSNHRGIAEIVQAMNHVRHPDARLLVLGREVDPFVHEAAQAEPGYARVDYHGMVPYDELYQAMRTAAVGLVCNQPGYDYDKSQPNKLFEYMSAGLPVIASHFPLWKEVVEGNACGLTVEPTRPAAIAAAVDELLADPERRRRMGHNGRRAVLERYNWAVEGRKLRNLYEELLPLCGT